MIFLPYFAILTLAVASQAASSRNTSLESSQDSFDQHFISWNAIESYPVSPSSDQWPSNGSPKIGSQGSLRSINSTKRRHKWKKREKTGKGKRQRTHKKKKNPTRGKVVLQKNQRGSKDTKMTSKYTEIANSTSRVPLDAENKWRRRENSILSKGKKKRHKSLRKWNKLRKNLRRGHFGATPLRWKGLSSQYRRPSSRQRNLGLPSKQWTRPSPYQRNHLPSSLRDRLHNHIEKTRQQWLRDIDPHTLFMESFPSFSEIPKDVLPPFPSLPQPLVPHFKRRKNGVINRSRRPDKKYSPSYPKPGFLSGSKDRKRKTNTWSSDSWTTRKTIIDERPVFVTELNTLPLATTPKSFIQRTKSIYPGKREPSNTISTPIPFPHPSNHNKDVFESITTSPVDDKTSWISTATTTPITETITAMPNLTHANEEPQTFISYGNDVVKGGPNYSPKINHEHDWEWVTLNSEDNDVNYDKDDGDVEREWGGKGGGREGEGKEESGEESEEETAIDTNRCLECPPKKTDYAQRGHDYVPLFIPTPKDNCNSRSVMRFHVEVSPGNPEAGALLKEGHYFINVSILGGSEGKTILKTCIYDYEVQVYKCPPLPLVDGGEAECSAGQAWGSKCLWKCGRGKGLIGSSLTTCGGDKTSPTWSHTPPQCEYAGCPIPPKIQGVALSCTIPIPHESLTEKLKLLKMYPEGSSCQVRCGSTLTSPSSKFEAMTVSKCQPTGKWLPDISTCCVQKKLFPQPPDGECGDITVRLRGHSSVRVPPPRFITADGSPAHVWCNKDAVWRQGRQCRTCKAHDPTWGVTGSCRQCINVEVQQGCPSIKAPINGSLECKNTANGDILCKITCKDGFRLPPKLISSGMVYCLRGMSLWDFQSSPNSDLPPCVLR